MSTKINIDARPHEVEEVWLGDDGPFEFVTPKIAPITSVLQKMNRMNDMDAAAAIAEAQEKWLRAGFQGDDWQHIVDRLDDMDDALDWTHLTQLFESLMEKVTGRPPTSSGGSSAGSPRKTSGGRQRPNGSTRGHSLQGEPATL